MSSPRKKGEWKLRGGVLILDGLSVGSGNVEVEATTPSWIWFSIHWIQRYPQYKWSWICLTIFLRKFQRRSQRKLGRRIRMVSCNRLTLLYCRIDSFAFTTSGKHRQKGLQAFQR